jgi:hypothetical protein
MFLKSHISNLHTEREKGSMFKVNALTYNLSPPKNLITPMYHFSTLEKKKKKKKTGIIAN